MILGVIEVVLGDSDLIEHLDILLLIKGVTAIEYSEACFDCFAGFFTINDRDRCSVDADEPGIRHLLTCRIYRVWLCEDGHTDNGGTDEQNREQQTDFDLSLFCGGLFSTKFNHNQLSPFAISTLQAFLTDRQRIRDNLHKTFIY